MADQAPVLPAIKPGNLIWTGRFRNRPAIISKVWSENGVLKFELIPIPQGRKHPKVRNLLPFRLMEPADAAKYKAIYDAEQRQRRQKTARVMLRHLASANPALGRPQHCP